MNRHFGLIALLVVVLGFVFTAAAQQYTTSGSWKGATVRLGTATTNHLELGASGDAAANDRYVVRADGRTQWGGGAAVPDTELQRTAANTLTLSAGDTLEAPVFTGIGAAAAILGDSGSASASIVTDGGTVTIDGTILGRTPVVSLASGALTMNTVNLVTAAGDVDVPDATCAVAADLGTWFTVVLEDDSVVVAIRVQDASNTLFVPGLDLGAADELDSVSTAAHEGQHITFTCIAADQWYMTGGNLTNATGAAIAWADGGTS